MQYTIVADTLTGIKGAQLKAGDIVNDVDLENNIPELLTQGFIKEVKPESKTKKKEDDV